MSALLHRRDQAVSATEISRSPKKYFDALSSGEHDHYVIMRNNKPEVVVLPVDSYERILDEIEDLKMELLAVSRIDDMDNDTKVISHKDMRSRFK